jgi:hypothetical protein
MLALTPPTPPRPELLDAPGGFSWWYADIVDAAGDGLVLIAAWGMPFLPGYAGAARAGAPQTAGSRPSINLALYRGGAPCFYLLQETPGAWESDTRWRFGDNVVESVIEGGRRRLVATLDCPVAGTKERLQGRVEVVGPARRPGPDEVADGPHRWTPLAAPARGTADLSVGDWRFACSGRAYHDRNESERPLDGLGIGEWLWGRAPAGDHEVIWYLLWPDDGGPLVAWGLELGPDGSTTPIPGLTVHLDQRRRARYGLGWWDKLELRRDGAPWIVVTHGPAVDDGPFYLRFLPWVESLAGRARGVAEFVRPDRVDIPWMRPFVRMRVRPAAGRPSPWLPLFEGTAHDRAARLWAGWTGV